MTLGDVLATVNGILAAGASLWAALVLTSLLFEGRARAAATQIEQRPWRCIGLGFLLLGTAGLIGLALINQPNGLLKLMGWISLGLLFSLATLGGSGLTLFVADRIRNGDTNLSPFQASVRAALLLVGASLIPVLGWIIGVTSFIANVGAAMLSLRRPRPAANPSTVPVILPGAPSSMAGSYHE